MKRTMHKKVFVGLSGGVDSAVAAALLKQQGYDVHGVFLREYDMSMSDALRDTIECTQEDNRVSAVAVAAHLDIPFEEWDFRLQYKEHVVDYLFGEYRSGSTPNPDVMCNKYIKFGSFLKEAKKRGADFIATGHYARKALGARLQALGNQEVREQKPKASLRIAKDTNKDQTYFLYTLTQKQLQSCLFPLGGLTKPEVRKIAKNLHLPNWNRKDSQGICFVGKIAMKDFLQTKLTKKPGPLMTREGTRVGTHEGAAYYTIGQRHGIGYQGGDSPYFVVDKDMKKNIVIVARGEKTSELFKKELTCGKVHWVRGKEPELPVRFSARIRYRQPLQHCRIVKGKAKGRLYVVFDRAQRAVTPGQAIVLYHRGSCLGGGIIE